MTVEEKSKRTLRLMNYCLGIYMIGDVNTMNEV